ncbi:dihydropteroate synthase [Thalassotalea sp. 1_MG-2023]|uniref:dihydropteroate synthase n=1 Tax=Thalassotalea sp. 1_MG-2023 TaxID=3062680 RepID=UPI0026E1EE2B|nr:dihydropteroate synthase [Thalassotalea sp. 1_MG-2023]MDO6426827.1 dihydropteroate synthase [Thalassotalea sp. 1_MG-2023]
MGILNVTPDSFSDGGNYTAVDSAILQAKRMIDDGASIIDIGGESTRPGAAEVAIEDELQRTIPVIEAIKARFDTVISIDTSKARVMAEAISAGADLINDVRALQEEGCLEVVAKSKVPVCLMHMQGQPRTMQTQPQYNDVVNDIMQFFTQRIETCERAGIARDRIILDPGFGFGKTLEQNYDLLANLAKFKRLNLPILSGTSRKSMIGNLLNRVVSQRLAGSLTTAILAVEAGASIIRVHDVQETVDSIKILQYMHQQQA